MTLEKKEDLNLESIILKLRGENVILAPDLAAIFGVETRVLNQAVKRNMRKFPPAFMFQLTAQEVRKIAITNCDHNFNMIAVCFHGTRLPDGGNSPEFRQGN